MLDPIFFHRYSHSFHLFVLSIKKICTEPKEIKNPWKP